VPPAHSERHVGSIHTRIRFTKCGHEPVYIYQTAFQFGRIGYAAGLGWVLFALILLLTLGVFRSARGWVFYAGE